MYDLFFLLRFLFVKLQVAGYLIDKRAVAAPAVGRCVGRRSSARTYAVSHAFHTVVDDLMRRTARLFGLGVGLLRDSDRTMPNGLPVRIDFPERWNVFAPVYSAHELVVELPTAVGKVFKIPLINGAMRRVIVEEVVDLALAAELSSMVTGHRYTSTSCRRTIVWISYETVFCTITSNLR